MSHTVISCFSRHHSPRAIVLAGLIATAICGSVAPVAHAQQTFLFPAWGGYIAHPFNDLHALKEGWYHAGVDILGPGGGSTYILASNVGVVQDIILNGYGDHGFGNCVIIRHTVPVSSNGATYRYYTLYAHLASITSGLRIGQAVSRGQIIGVMGKTGNPQYQIHLHFEVKTAGILTNPSGGGPYFGYTPAPAQYYGYVNPASVIGSWTALPISR